MRKNRIIMAAVLVVYMLLSAVFFASCGGGSDLDGFNKAVSATKPTNITGEVSVNYKDLGSLEATFDSEIAEDGSFEVNYTYTKFNNIGSGSAEDTTSTLTGTVTYKNGAYSDTSLAAKLPADATATKLKLNADKMTYTLSKDGNVLAGTVKAANTKAVFGVEYASDVTFVLTKTSEKIVSLSMTYTLTEGTVEVVCNYQ